MGRIDLTAKKGSGSWNFVVIGAVVVGVLVLGFLLYNFLASSDALKKFAHFSVTFQYFVDREALSVDGEDWKMSTKEIRTASRLIQYVPVGQSLDLSTKAFMYLEQLVLPPTSSDAVFERALKLGIDNQMRKCPSGQLNILDREYNFATFEMVCQEAHAYYALNSTVFNDGVVGVLTFDQASTSDLEQIRTLGRARAHALLQDGVWKGTIF